jgi:amino acid adenylation domain-containing protein
VANPAGHQEATGFRLSPQQELLLLHDRGTNTQCAVALGAVDADRLRATLASLTRRYEILRTGFVRSTGMRLPTQVILEEVEPSLEVVERPLDDVVAEEAARVFDLTQAPLLRAVLVSSPEANVLVLTAHPAVADAQSLLELARSLEAGSEGEEPLQYADYAEWRAEVAAEATAEGDDDEVAPAPPLLFGRLPAPDDTPSVRTHELAVSPDLAEALAAAASAQKVSRALLVEACWHACVHRLCGAQALTITGVTNGRNHGELAGAVGAFSQLIEITSRCEPTTSLAEVVDQVRRAREAGTRGEDGLSGADLDRVAQRTTISFQALEAALPSADIQVLRTTPTHGSLQLMWIETADVPRAELVYDSVAYDEADVEQLASSLLTVLAAAPTVATVGELPIVTETRRAELVALLQGPALDVPRETYHALFEQQAARSPESPAVRDAGGSLTYAELNGRANALAARLRELGVGRNDAVGMCTHRSIESLVAVLGILKAGGAYVPLNFDHPEARLLHQLTETGARAVVAEPDLADRFSSFGGEVVTTEPAQSDAPNPEHTGDGGDLAYVMYTSGSTGLPKGVEVTHANLVDYSLTVVDRLGLAHDSALDFAVVSAISTDLGNTSIFPALLTGGCVNLVAPDTAMDPEAFSSVMREWGVDVLKITPSHLGALLAGSDSADVLPRRLLVLGGEALPWQLARDIAARSASLEVVNHYGPTETTVGVCTFALGTDVDAWHPRTVPIGRPLANAAAYVVDEAGDVVPPGVAGELLLGGAGVARGYVGRPDETAERFVADRFGEGNVYRTGDRARCLPDGSIEFLGRFDDQLKIRGYRVEPGEVEAALGRHPAVKQAAVRAVEDGTGTARLVAYAVTRSPVAGEELHAFLAESLPDYMIPSAFVSLDALPLTASGKVDRLALPDPGSLDADREASYVAPRNDVEAEIARIWSELLGVERVGVFDDFFELGGHSLLATQVIMRVRRVYGDVPLQAMFMAPTPAGLAEVIQASGTPAEAAS